MLDQELSLLLGNKYAQGLVNTDSGGPPPHADNRRFAIARTSARARRSLPAHSQQPGQPLPIGFVPLWGLPVSADPEAVYSGSRRRGCPCLLPEVKNRVGRKNKLNDSPGVQLFASPQSKELRKTRLSPKGLGCRCGFQEDRKTVTCGGGTGGRAVLSGSSSPAISSNPPNNPVWEVFAGEETETGLGEVTCSRVCRCDWQTWDPDAGPPSPLPIHSRGPLTSPASSASHSGAWPRPLRAPIPGRRCSPPSNVASWSPDLC